MSPSRSVTLVAAASLCLASGAWAQNILPNSHFDSDLDGWTETHPEDISWSSEGSGAPGSVRIDSDDEIGAALYACVPVTAGMDYAIEVDVKLETHGQTFGKVGIQLFWKADAECQVDTGGLQPFGLSTSAPDWQHLAVGHTAPANAVSARVQLVAVRFMGSEGSSITGWLDDAFVGASATTTTTGTSTTTLATEPGCADPAMPYGKVTAGDALFVLKGSVGAIECDPCLCDTNISGNVTAGDALAVLRKAVGFEQPIDCVSC